MDASNSKHSQMFSHTWVGFHTELHEAQDGQEDHSNEELSQERCSRAPLLQKVFLGQNVCLSEGVREKGALAQRWLLGRSFRRSPPAR